jgi:hypothetical protein
MAVPNLHCCTVQTGVEIWATDNNIRIYGSTVRALPYSTVQNAGEFGSTDHNITLSSSTATDNNITLYGSTDPALLYSTECCGVLGY